MARRGAYFLLLILCFAGCPHDRDACGRQMPREPPPVSIVHAAGTTLAPPTPTPEPTRDTTRHDAPRPPVDLSGIDVLVTQAIAASKIPGCVVSVGNRSGVLYQRPYGERALRPAPEKMLVDTRFDLASLSKSVVTSIAIMQLVEKGLLRLDQPAVTVLPELDAGAGRFHKRRITVRQLLLHSSGLPAVTPLSDYERARPEAIARVLSVAPIDKPGARFVYSDVGFIALGEIVSRVSGQTLSTYAQEHIWGPLGMTRSSYGMAPELRGEAAPTELGVERDGQWIRGVVHDPRAFRLGGEAGNAGVFSTADDLARLARALMNDGALDGQRILTPQSVATMTEPYVIGSDVRALGWDMDSRYSNNGGDLLSARAYGHGGYTGTSLWIDPQQDLFVLLLSNRVHPHGQGDAIQLAGAIANHAVSAITRHQTRRQPDAATSGGTHTGIDVLRQRGFDALHGKQVGLVTNQSARARDGISTLDLFKRDERFTLKAVFTPEHGLAATHEGHVADAALGDAVPVFSLFGTQRKPTAEMLQGIDTLVFDLQDVGVRFYTYGATLVQILEAAREHDLHVVVLDRPNPLNGVAVEGPLPDPGSETFVNYHRLPVRHGMTIGELALLLNTERDIHASLEVIAMTSWQRSQGFEDTGLAWNAPSPNLRTVDQAWLYPALGLLESTNVTVGRGTELPFSIIGAPWLDASRLAQQLRRQFADVRAVPMEIAPTAGPYQGERCRVVQISVGDRAHYQPVRLALAIAQHLALHQPEWKQPDMFRMLRSQRVMAALRGTSDVAKLDALWADDLREFLQRRQRFLLYP